MKKYNPRKKRIVCIFGINEKEKIIEYYLSNKSNSYKQISNDLGFTEYQVNKTVNEYFNNNLCIIAESKMNKL